MDEPTPPPTTVTVEVETPPPVEPPPSPPPIVDQTSMEIGAQMEGLRNELATLRTRIETAAGDSETRLRADLSELTGRLAALELQESSEEPDDAGDLLAVETDQSQATPVTPDIPPPTPGVPKKARPGGILGVIDRVMFG